MTSDADKLKKEDMDLHDKKIAKEYESVRESCRFSKHYQEQWIRDMVAATPGNPEHILDYCCGTSILFPFITEKFPNATYYGIDLSNEMLNVGRKRFSNLTSFIVSQQDGENLEYTDCFNAIISRGALHHLPDPGKGLRSIKKAMKNDGSLIISEPTSNILIKGMRWIMYRLSSHFASGHKSFTLGEMKKLLHENGYTIVTLQRYGLLAYPFGFPDVIRVFRYFPYGFLRFLEKCDKRLLRIPVIRNFAWSVIIVAKKR